MRLGFYCLLIAVIAITPALTQTEHPSFAVATIKPHDPESSRQGFDAHGDRFTIQAQTVAGLMMYAYSVHPRQIVDAPDWARHDHYDIDGKTDTGAEPNLRQQQEMIQKLLADRFRLRFHREKRDLDVYAIHIAKGGPKLTPAANPDAPPDQNGNSRGNGLTQFYTSASISDFIRGMQFFLDRPLVDQTGLTGRYDLKIVYTPDELRTADTTTPGIFTAVQEQLGLKLDSVKAPCDVFAIDTIERPSAN